MPSILIPAFIIALSIIVAIHEYGHYIVGRWSGIHADVFSIGFGPVIWSRKDRHGTVWQVTEPVPGVRNRLKSLKIDNPPAILAHA